MITKNLGEDNVDIQWGQIVRELKRTFPRLKSVDADFNSLGRYQQLALVYALEDLSCYSSVLRNILKKVSVVQDDVNTNISNGEIRYAISELNSFFNSREPKLYRNTLLLSKRVNLYMSSRHFKRISQIILQDIASKHNYNKLLTDIKINRLSKESFSEIILTRAYMLSKNCSRVKKFSEKIKCLETVLKKDWTRYVYQELYSLSPYTHLALEVLGPKMLEDIFHACEKLHMRPFLVFGTLLGYCREGSFMKHDCDIDLGMLKSDFSRIKQLKQQLKRKGYVVLKENKYMIKFVYPLVKQKNIYPMWVDIFLFYKKEDKMACSSITRNRNNLLTYTFPQSIFKKFDKGMFQGKVEVIVPSQAKKFLKVCYGDWEIPRPDFNERRDMKNLKIVKYKRKLKI